VGGELRYDNISDANLYNTIARARTGTVRDDSVRWLSVGAFAEITIHWTSQLRTILGLRGDHSDYGIDASQAANSGKGDDRHLMPSVALAYQVNDFVGVPSNVDEIRNARDQVIGAGITFVQPQGLTASLRLRHFAEAPLTEDGSISHGDTTLVNAGLQYDFGSWRAGLEFLNLFDAQDDDIAYYFVSRLPGEAAPVEDIHFYPVMPFSVRASIRWELGG